MNYFFIFLLLCSPLGANIPCLPTVKQAQDKGDYKSAIQELQNLLQKKPSAELYLCLSVNLLLDQQEEEAFKSFMLCLDKALVKKNVSMTPSEELCYQELLPLYLENSEALTEKVQAVLHKHPDFLHCQFLLAAQFANEKKFEQFFSLFYAAYCRYPESHMAYKTKGVVASLLFQRARSQEEKEAWRMEALSAFKQAMQVMPADSGLHKMLIYTASDKERKEIVKFVFDTILEREVVIRRTEIPFYINHALWVQESARAQLLIDKAKSWYQYSRILQELQQLIDQQQQK